MAIKDKSKYRLVEGASLSAPDAKKRLIDLINDGVTVEDACRAVGKSVKSYEYYRSSDPQFKEAIDLARVIKRRKGTISEEDANISFEDFRTKYLGSMTFPHQRNVTSLLEEGEPAWLHGSMTYEKNFKNYVLVNMPPSWPVLKLGFSSSSSFCQTQPP